jgi:hypothetical protein
MPFGRHKGDPLDEIPDGYLRWLLNRDLREPLRSHVRAEAQRREADEDATHDDYRRRQRRDDTPPRSRHAIPPVDDVDNIIASGLHALAKKYHPDLGGDLRRMQAINHAADWLRARVRELLS